MVSRFIRYSGAAKKEAYQDQAQGRAEGVGHHAVQIFLQENRRNAQHRFGAEPGGKHGGRYHVERQVASGNREVLGGMNPGGGPQTDAD
jgi:hypothetical protein